MAAKDYDEIDASVYPHAAGCLVCLVVTLHVTQDQIEIVVAFKNGKGCVAGNCRYDFHTKCSKQTALRKYLVRSVVYPQDAASADGRELLPNLIELLTQSFILNSIQPECGNRTLHFRATKNELDTRRLQRLKLFERHESKKQGDRNTANEDGVHFGRERVMECGPDDRECQNGTSCDQARRSAHQQHLCSVLSLIVMRGFRVAVVLIFGACVATAACGGGSGSSNPTSPSVVNVPFTQTDLRVGTGAEATTGRRATVNYTGWLYDAGRPELKGQQFDSSLAAGRTPFTFTVGAREVIAGWDRGVPGMKVGGQRRLVIPPDLAYGSQGRPPTIPPNSTLVFDIELLDVP